MADSLASKVTRLKAVSVVPLERGPEGKRPRGVSRASRWVRPRWRLDDPGGGRACGSRGGGGSGPVQRVPRPDPDPLCPHQLALDIDRDTEDQNRYLDGMVRVSPALCRWAALGTGGSARVTGRVPPSGLGLHEHDRPAHGEREALLHDGAVWARQPEAAVRRGRGPDRGLLHPLLPPVQSKDVSQWGWLCGRPGQPGSPARCVATEDLLPNTALER